MRYRRASVWVVLNLCLNARDAMPRGGRLTLETANVDQGPDDHWGAPGGPCVMLAVSDTGVGMSREMLERIFEPFFTTKEPGQGTGLGLATVEGIVRQHGGAVSVASEPGRNSTFRVFLPRVEEPAEAPAPRQPARSPGSSETVLVVDDDPGLAELVRKVLAEWGYLVLGARHPTEALDVARHYPGPIHLVLTDAVMAGMSGPELADRLAALRPGLRVLYMSGYADDALGRHGILDPQTSFVAKPFAPEELARRVRETLDTPLQHPG